MKVRVSELKRPLTVTIAGDEEWLSQIYAGFPVPAGKDAPRLTGQVTFTPETANVVDVQGSLHYVPYIPCSRCLDPLPWKIDRDVEATYRLAPSSQHQKEKEVELSRADLDDYWIEGGVIDVEALINEEVQLAIPSQTVLPDEAGNGCPKCQDKGGEGPLYQAKSALGDKPENPFDVLKNLKLSK